MTVNLKEVLRLHTLWLAGDRAGRRAALSGADLSGANLFRAVLSSADLSGVILPPSPVILPPVGTAFRGWKKLADGTVAELEIPADAARVCSLVGRKCRAEYVAVVTGGGASEFAPATIYAPGATVRPDAWNDDVRVECTHGIHFFATRKEAENY